MEKVKYVSRDLPNYKLLMKPTTEEIVTDGVTGTKTKTISPGRWIQFEHCVYETSDPEEIKFIENHASFTGKTKDNKSYKRCIDKINVDRAEMEFVALVNEFGKDNVTSMLKKLKGGEEEKAIEVSPELEEAEKKLMEAKKKLAKAKKSGSTKDIKSAKIALRDAKEAYESYLSEAQG